MQTQIEDSKREKTKRIEHLEELDDKIKEFSKLIKESTQKAEDVVTSEVPVAVRSIAAQSDSDPVSESDSDESGEFCIPDVWD